ncbi:MAG: hypothetical protein QOD39_4358, partial [Mycobacterium sp.]|nr:hypothetical protein [Mycobacterium sp.]
MSSESTKPGLAGTPPGHTDSSPAHLQGDMGTLKLVMTVLAFNAPLGVMAATVPLVIGYGSGL